MPEWDAEVRRRLEALGLRPEREAEMVEELAQHLDDRYHELRGRGLGDAEARRAALDELADTGALGAATRPADRAPRAEAAALGAPRRGGALQGLWGDVRFGLRTLAKSPRFTLVAALTLALSIGAAVTVFAVLDAVLLRPLPFREPDRLIRFWGSAPEKGLPVVSYPDAIVERLRERSRTMTAVAAYTTATFTLTGVGDAERLSAANVTPNFFSTLGREPLHGRSFTAEEGTHGRNFVAVLSHGLWQRRFGGDPGIVGTAIRLDGFPTVVVGVMPPGFDFPGRAELWVPIGLEAQSLDCWCYDMLGRLAAGRTPADAAREVSAIVADLFQEREPGRTREEPMVVAEPLARTLTGDVRAPLLVLAGAVALVLLIACANIANLMLARGAARSREIALRCCLGASRGAIVRQLLVESLLLAAAGGVAGLVLAALGVGALERLAVERVTHLQGLAIDGWVVLFAAGVVLCTGVLFGLTPALRAARSDLAGALAQGERGQRGAGARRLSSGFVVAQCALSVVLLVGAALLLRSFQHLLAVDPGFRPENVLVARTSLPDDAYPRGAHVYQFYQRLAERVRALPGVREVGITAIAPFSRGGWQQEVHVEGRPPRPGEPVPVASVRAVSPAYFRAVGTPLLAGRPFAETDAGGAPLVAIVDETLARRYWPAGGAVGRRVRLSGADNPWLTIVGVARSVKHGSLRADADHYVYFPFAQVPLRSMDLVVRAAGEPRALAAALRREVRALDPQLPLYEVHTLEEAVARSLRTQRVTNLVLLAFAAAALALSAIGLYGVVSLDVGGRTRELGIRLALGARPAQLRAMVLGQGLRLVLFGTAAGLLAAAGLARLVRSLLFGVQPADPAVLGAAALLMALVALAAAYGPARRATGIDPVRALRAE